MKERDHDKDKVSGVIFKTISISNLNPFDCLEDPVLLLPERPVLETEVEVLVHDALGLQQLNHAMGYLFLLDASVVLEELFQVGATPLVPPSLRRCFFVLNQQLCTNFNCSF